MIDLQGVSRTYGAHAAVRDVSLRIPKGSVVALIGPSGSGKTTLLRLLDLLERPTAGRYLFDGVDTGGSEQQRLAIRRRIAMVFQKPVPLATTVGGNVAAGLRYRKVPKEEIRARMAAALAMVGLSGLADRDAATLSGGEMQRVALARALVTEPEVLLMDEPTANLDPENTTLIEEVVRRVNRTQGITIVLSTHDMGQGQRLADTLALIMQGRVHQSGRAQDLFSYPGTPEAARFMGFENLLEGSVVEKQDDLTVIDIGPRRITAVSDAGVGEGVTACIRAEDLTLLSARSTQGSARNTLAGTITRIALHGSFARVTVDTGFPVTALITRRSAEEMEFRVGQPICVTFKATAVHVIRRADHSPPAAG
ncbi:MAG: ABC transporter ATP-binding protein [Methanomicrobiales archaeon]|nr:ABC transporter ATP-binding protein [Methanomicrobiales archaeon]